MIKVSTLRNIITFLMILFIVGCNKFNDKGSSSITVHKISSEDENYGNIVDVVSDPESGKQVYIVVSK